MSSFIPLLRGSFLYLSRQPRLRRWVETSPQAGRFTSRFIAGLHIEDALRVAVALKRENVRVTLDHLGENVHTAEEAAKSRVSYCQALDRLQELELGATISVKLTALGLDVGKEIGQTNLLQLVERAVGLGTRVEVDMEDSSYVDRTLEILQLAHARYPGGVRAVIQAYLYRSEQDIVQLNREGIPVRLCKGAYKEPPAVAYPKKADVDANYVKLLDLLLEHGTYPAIATHDPEIVRHALAKIQSLHLTRDRYEFEMLYGVGRNLQAQLSAEGHCLRLYVPYGDAWYPYFMRRLAERPANVAFILKNLFR